MVEKAKAYGRDQNVKISSCSHKILERIRSGVYVAGSPLPPEKDLADELGMNHQTIRRGLSELSREG